MDSKTLPHVEVLVLLVNSSAFALRASAIRRWLASRSRERSERFAKAGGEYRARTGDLLVANQALSQLS